MGNSTLATRNGSAQGDIMEAVIAKGDLALLTGEQRARYYAAVCESIGLNPFTRPFEYLRLGDKTVLYAGRNAADQLRSLHKVNIEVVRTETTADGIHIVTVKATAADGRSDTEIGALNIAGLKGEALANALMKCMTKAKRRATLSICGLGWLDESEVGSIQGARRLSVAADGELIEQPSVPAIAPSSASPATRRFFAVGRDLLEIAQLKALVYLAAGVESTKDANDADITTVANALDGLTPDQAKHLFTRAENIGKLATVDLLTNESDLIRREQISDAARALLLAIVDSRIGAIIGEETGAPDAEMIDPETGEILSDNLVAAGK